MKAAYYNEPDPQKAAWLTELMRRDVVAAGEMIWRVLEQGEAAMRHETQIRNRELGNEILLPVTIEVELERQEEESAIRLERVRCHHYHFTEEFGVDIFLVEAGRLVRKAAYNGVLGVRELEPDEGG